MLKYQRSMMINESADENDDQNLISEANMQSHGNFNDFKQFCSQLVKEEQLSHIDRQLLSGIVFKSIKNKKTTPLPMRTTPGATPEYNQKDQNRQNVNKNDPNN